jgi:uncharacterized protein with NAD-binding domain and iron-sulfur cluster
MSKSDVIRTDVAILGGGLAGLTAAYYLSQKGFKTLVLEADTILGGRARSWQDDKTGDTIDIAPHILVDPLYPNTMALLADLGTSEQIVWNKEAFITLAEGAERFDLGYTKFPAPLHLLPWVIQDKTLSLVDHLSAVPLILYVLRMNPAGEPGLDQENALGFLRRMGVTQRYIGRLFSFMCMAIMNVPINLCSAGALLRFFKIFLARNDYVVGFAEEGLGELYAPQSVAAIKSAGGDVLLNTSIVEVLDNGKDGVALRLSDGRRVESRHQISTLPAQTLRRIVPQRWNSEHKPFRDLVQFQPSPYVGVYLWFDKKLTDMKFWARTHDDNDLNCDFYDLSNINPRWKDRPSLIASNIIYSYRATHLTDDQIIEGTLNELAEFLPHVRDAQLTHAKINRIPVGIYCPFPGIDAYRPSTRTPIDRFFLAGDWTQTSLPFSMESAVRSGALAAEAVLSDEGQSANLAVELQISGGLSNALEWTKFGSPQFLRGLGR